MSTTLERPPEIEEKDKTYDLWNVIILNDHFHTFRYVVDMIIECVQVSTQEAFQMTTNIHEKGREIVFSGNYEAAEHFYERLSNYPLEEKFGQKLPKIGIEIEPA